MGLCGDGAVTDWCLRPGVVPGAQGFAPPANVKVVPVPEMSGIKAKDARRDLGTECVFNNI